MQKAVGVICQPRLVELSIANKHRYPTCCDLTVNMQNVERMYGLLGNFYMSNGPVNLDTIDDPLDNSNAKSGTVAGFASAIGNKNEIINFEI